jgi:hypothetical protein
MSKKSSYFVDYGLYSRHLLKIGLRGFQEVVNFFKNAGPGDEDTG